MQHPFWTVGRPEWGTPSCQTTDPGVCFRCTIHRHQTCFPGKSAPAVGRTETDNCHPLITHEKNWEKQTKNPAEGRTETDNWDSLLHFFFFKAEVTDNWHSFTHEKQQQKTAAGRTRTHNWHSFSHEKQQQLRVGLKQTTDIPLYMENKNKKKQRRVG